MSMRELAWGAIAFVAVGCAAATAVQTPNLGRPATPAEISGWDISVGPDGIGLPPGSGTALKGAAVYEQRCQATIGSYWPYATTVFDYVRRAMPYTQPQSLTDDEVYAVTAYLLNLNGIIGDQDEMNAQTLPRVTMPNRENFIVVYPARRR